MIMMPALRILKMISTLALLSLGATVAHAADPVHFGSIFSEDQKTQNTLENKDSLNNLTERTGQQKVFEEIHPELKAENDKNRQIQNTPQQPSYSNNAVYPENAAQHKEYSDKKIGMVKNSELEPKVVYFLELRPIPGNTPKDIYFEPNTYNSAVSRLQPGEMVKVIDSSSDYIHKMRSDRDNQGIWRQVGRRETGDPRNLYVYYDWKNFETIHAGPSAIDLDILVPRDMSSIPVFGRPGSWTWKDCELGTGVCIDRIDQHAMVLLLDTSYTVVTDLRTRQDVLQLYYKIGYKLTDKAGVEHTRVGWIPSYYARRKITSVPRSILTQNQNGTGFETDEERAARLSKFYVFQDNISSENKIVSRWLKKRPGSVDEVFDNTFSYDALVAYNSFNMKQSFLDDEFKQSAISVGIGIYAPIYVDLELQGTATFSMPISHSPETVFPDAPLFRGDQWLMYTTPVGLEGTPIKVGVGMYYLSMFESTTDFGFKSFVGFQGKVGIENERFWLDVRFGPTGQDFDFNLTNRELGASVGIRVDPSKGFDSLTLFMDYSETTYTSPLSSHTTDFTIFNVGFRKTFK
jgi:hypothetical protein